MAAYNGFSGFFVKFYVPPDNIYLYKRQIKKSDKYVIMFVYVGQLNYESL